MVSSGKSYLKAILVSATALPLIAAFALPASAQELEEIIVTAQKRSEKLQDVPISVTALQGSQLVASGIDTVKQLAALTPNIAVNANANYIAPYIRGVGTQYANPGLEPSVATYLDDVYLSRPSGGFLSFSDIERVEVLKGPQGILYGRNTTGGAIHIVTKEPTKEFHAGLGFTAGNYGRLGGDGYISGTILPNLTGRLAFQYDHNDGWLKNITPGGPQMEDRNLVMFRGKLNWSVNDKLTVKFSADYMDKEDHEGEAFLPLFGHLPEQTALAVGGLVDPSGKRYSGNIPGDGSESQGFHLKAGGAELRIDYALDGYTLSSITGTRYTRFNGLADLDATTAGFYNANTKRELSRDWSQEFQAVSDGSGPLNWTAGVFYWHEAAWDDFGASGIAVDGSFAPTLGAPPVGSGWFAGGNGKVDIDSIAPYGYVSYKITPQWEFLLGGRYTIEEKKLERNIFYATTVDAVTTLQNGPTLVLNNDTPDSITAKEFTPQIKLTWRPIEKLMFYASYTKGFKSGGFNLPAPALTVDKVQNETLQSVEFGWKTEFGPVRFDGAYFHYEAKNLQVQVTDPSAGITSIRNAGSSTTNGVEADLTVAVSQRLELGGGIGWMDAKFDKFPNGQAFIPCADAAAAGLVDTAGTCAASGGLGLATVARDLKGNKLPQAPEWSGYIRAAYNQPLPNSLGTINAGFVYSYTGSFSWTSDNLYNEPAKWLLNATLGWKSEDGRYGISAFGTNLTDKSYNTHEAPFAGTGGWRVPGRPREYGVRLSYDF